MKGHNCYHLGPSLLLLAILTFVSHGANLDSNKPIKLHGEKGKAKVLERYVREVTPQNVTFALSNPENKTEVMVGSQVTILLTIHFPIDLTEKLVVDLVPPSIMAICSAEVSHIGSNLVVTRQDINNTYDGAIINFGNVSNSGSNTTTDSNSMIYIEWNIVMVENINETENGNTYWVNAGAEYMDGQTWAGQTSVVATTEEIEPQDPPTCELTGPNGVKIDTSAIYRVDMYLPNVSTTLVFEAFAADASMSVCSMAVVDTGKNYKCLGKRAHLLDGELFARESGKGNDRAKLNIGKVTNTGAKDSNNTWEDNRISVEFVIYMCDNISTIGQNHSVACAVKDKNSTIWAGQMQVTALSKGPPPDMNGTHDAELTVLNGEELMVDEFTKLELNVSLPEKTVGDYEIEISMPYDSSGPRMMICQVALTYKGANIPCMPETKPEYESRTTSLEPPDHVVWNLGRLRNTAHRSSEIDPNANTMKFEITGKMLNHIMNEDGAELVVNVGVNATSNMWVGQVPLTFAGGSDRNVTAPTFELKYSLDNDHIPVGASTEVILDIRTTPGAVYSPLIVQLMLPVENNNTDVISVCREEILHVGKNHPCFDQTLVSVSKSYDGTESTLSLHLGSICNTRDPLTPPGDLEDDVIRFSFVVRVNDRESLVNGTQLWLRAAVTYSDNHTWDGQLALHTLRDVLLPPPPQETPHFEILHVDDQVSQPVSVPRDHTAKAALLVKLPPLSTTSVKVVAHTTSVPIGIMDIVFKESRYGVPCLNNSSAPMASATGQHPGTALNSGMELDFGLITNVADDTLVADSVFDNNTIRVDVLIVIDMEAEHFSEHLVTFDLEFGDTLPLSTSITLTIL